MLDTEGLKRAVLTGDRDAAAALATSALAAGAAPGDILNAGLLPGMDAVGQGFARKELYLGEVLLAARAMQAGIAVLKPALARAGAGSGPKRVVVIGTVKGDLHDIGKNLVTMMLEAGGIEVVDLGTNVSTSQFLDAIRTHNASVVALSALLTTTMRQMRQTIEELRRVGAMDGVRTIVGGAPVTQEFADTIGADAWAPDAPAAVAAIRRLVSTP